MAIGFSFVGLDDVGPGQDDQDRSDDPALGEQQVEPQDKEDGDQVLFLVLEVGLVVAVLREGADYEHDEPDDRHDHRRDGATEVRQHQGDDQASRSADETEVH